MAILGTRGIPARYGGFETFAQELSVRLVERGHEVTVYGRSHLESDGAGDYRGVTIRQLPAVRTKHLETVTHTGLSILDAAFKPFDLLLVCNAANAFLCWLPGLVSQRVILNVDGIEHRRKKWGTAGRWVHRFGEFLATQIPDAVVADAAVIARYYYEEYGFSTRQIAYGAPSEPVKSQTALQEWGLKKGEYLLYVSRLEPENNALLVTEAYLQARPEFPLVIVGDAPYGRAYIDRLRRLAREGDVLLTGGIYGEPYRQLLSHCLCYIQATEVGGTHPALIEAMGAGALVIANRTPENIEVVADSGLFYPYNDVEVLASLMQRVSSNPGTYREFGQRARQRVRDFYDWEGVVDQYEALFYDVLAESPH